MPQQPPQQFPTHMAHQQSSSSSGLQSYDYTMSMMAAHLPLFNLILMMKVESSL